jgi:maltooligosyltrehalose trehalohydrolase
MGEEWAASQPFPFFCDFGPDLADAVREGRRREFARFPEFRDETARARIPDPNAESTFHSAILDWTERERDPHRHTFALYRRLLELRHREIVPRLAGIKGGEARYVVLGDRALSVTWRLGEGASLMVFANMSDEAVEKIGGMPDATPFFALGENAVAALAKQRLLPWSVVWFLDSRIPSRRE